MLSLTCVKSCGEAELENWESGAEFSNERNGPRDICLLRESPFRILRVCQTFFPFFLLFNYKHKYFIFHALDSGVWKKSVKDLRFEKSRLEC